MSKLFGFLLGIAVALALPAGFGGLAAEGGIELSARELALGYGIGALVFWTVVSYFAGAAALGAALTFGAMIYAVHWIPNRMRNLLDDVPGVTTGMIDGIRDYTLNGLVPVLAVISLVYAIQLMVRAAQRRRRHRAEAAVQQREQEYSEQQESAGEYRSAAPYPAPAPYPAGGAYSQGGDYPTSVDNQYQQPYGEDAHQTRQREPSREEPTAHYPGADSGASTNRDETAEFPAEPTGRSGADGPTGATGADSTRYEPDAATAEFPASAPAEGESPRSGSHQVPEPQSESGPGRGQGTGSSQGGGASSWPGAPAQPDRDDGPGEPGRRDQGNSQSNEHRAGPDGGRDLGPQASAHHLTVQRPTAGFHQPGHAGGRSEQYGPLYRERMDNPEHHFTVEPEHHPQAFLTNQFRIA